MTDTPNLGLPYIDPAQAQKHVTHNAALAELDAIIHLSVRQSGVVAPPATPAAGDRYLVGAGATGGFAGQDGNVASFIDGAWLFATPRAGWRCFVESGSTLLVNTGGAWSDVATLVRGLQNLAMLGVGAAADATNPFSAKLNAALFTARAATEGGSGDMRMTLNKSSTAGTVSQLYQNGYSGRAETGLCGDDHFHLKVSADGATWREALNVDPSTGLVSFPSGVANAINTISNGAGAPAAAAGVNGDFYVDTTNNSFYGPKAGGSWPASFVSLIGPAGANGLNGANGTNGANGVNGSTWYQGAGAPSAGLGANGDFYFNTSTSDIYVRASGAWGSPIANIRGAQGPAGTGGSGGSAPNKLVNGNFLINQRGYVSNATLAAGAYAHDRWKAGAGGCAYSYSQGSPDTTITIASGSLQQVIEGASIEGGVYTLSWSGTAQARVNSGSYASSPVTVTGLTAGANVTVEFNAGTLGLAMFNAGSSSFAFERRSLATELAFCQRYYYRWKSPRAQEFLGVTYAYSTTHTEGGSALIQFPVEMRSSTPTMGVSAASHFALMYQNGGNACSAMSLFANSRNAWIYDATWQAMATFGIYTCWANSASAWIDASAEL